MIRPTLALLAAFLVGTTTASAATPWVSDSSRSELGFVSAYSGDPVKGVFRKWSAQLDFDAADLPHSRLVVSVDTGSVETGVEEQEGALIGSDWLATKLFPEARFVTDTIRQGKAPGTFEATGELTLRGVTKPVDISFSASRGSSELALKGTASIDRSVFSVGTGPWSSADTVPFRVEVHFDLRARPAEASIADAAPSRAGAAERVQAPGATANAVPSQAASTPAVAADRAAAPASATPPAPQAAAPASATLPALQAAAPASATPPAPQAAAPASATPPASQAAAPASATPPALQAAASVTPPALQAAAPASSPNAAVADYTPIPAFKNQTRAPAPAVPSNFQVEVLTSGLVQPWSLAFLPDGRMLVTERPGRLRIVSRDGTQSPPIEGLPPIKTIAAEGLHDVVLDPGFARNRTLYFTYYAPLPNDTPPTLDAWIHWLELPAGEHEKQPFGFERVARARLSSDERRLEEVKVVLEGGDRRLVFARDGSLLVAAAPPAGGGIPVDEEPQRLGNTYGKVLRIKPDGSIPRDNPFRGRAGVRPEIFAYGLRDVEGAALDPRTGDLWTVEHGPRGGDELNHIRRGRNYGFPLISYGREYSGALINGGRTARKGLEQPVYFWTPSIAPSGLLFYTGDLFPAWKGSVFVGALAGKRLIRLQLDADRVIAEEPLLVERGKRIRDIRQGPDGAVYVLTAEPVGELLRLRPPD